MEHLERLETLLTRYSWDELPEADRQWVLTQVADEQTYTSLREAELQLHQHYSSVDLQPDPAVWERLQQPSPSFTRSSPRGLRTPVPFYGVAASVLLALFAGWWLGHTQEQPVRYIDKFVTRIDTVRLQMPSDTVIIEKFKVIYRDVAPVLTTVPTAPTTQPGKGVTMKEKEGLEMLMVSGGGRE
ncbi:MAG: hypothetical protein K1X47_17750 [Cyclobacteriaceae bacterium]|nr:hypothetical protein [Cyclobacteriaceae bacterium]